MNETTETVLVKDRMIKTFTTLPETLSPAEAGSRLQPGIFGVVLGKDGQPIALVTAGDVKKAGDCGAPRLDHPSAGLPPTIIITNSEMEIQILARSDAVTLFDIGARGAVVMEHNEITGVLPADAITDSIGSGEISRAAQKGYGAVVDAGLGGSHQAPLGRIRCFACGFVNTVSFIDEDNLPNCKNPDLPSHTLALH